MKAIQKPISALVGGCFIAVFVSLAYAYSYEFGHWWKLLNPPDNLYAPIILEQDASLWKGNVLNYELKYSYYDYYDVGVLLPPSALPSSMNKMEEPFIFSGRLKLELVSQDGKVVREKVVERPLAYKMGEDLEFYSAIVFDRFPLPDRGFRTAYKLKITILEEDHALAAVSSSIFLSVSSGI